MLLSGRRQHEGQVSWVAALPIVDIVDAAFSDGEDVCVADPALEPNALPSGLA